MHPTCPPARSTGRRLALGIALASAFAAATGAPFSTYFALAAVVAVLPQALACLWRVRRRTR